MEGYSRKAGMFGGFVLLGIVVLIGTAGFGAVVIAAKALHMVVGVVE